MAETDRDRVFGAVLFLLSLLGLMVANISLNRICRRSELWGRPFSIAGITLNAIGLAFGMLMFLKIVH
jgi:hypothetical protein